MKNLKIIFFLFCFLSSGAVFAEDKIVAIVNSEVVTQKDLDEFLNFARLQLSSENKNVNAGTLDKKIISMKGDLLQKLIEDRIIVQQAKKEKIKIDETRLQGKIEEVKRHYGSDERFQEALKEQGLVQSDIESKMREQALMFTMIDTAVRKKILINPTDVTAYYQQNTDDFRVPEQLDIDSLVMDNQDKAQEVFRSIKSGKDIAAVASGESLMVNKMSASRGQLRKEIEEAVFKLKAGEITQPLKIDDKFYIFRLNGTIPAHLMPLSEVRDKIYTFLYNKKMEENLASWLDGLKKNSYIKIF